MDALVFIEEKDGEGGGIDEFLDLVLAEVAEESGLLVQPVCFIDDQPAEGVGRSRCEGPGADEEIGDARFLQGAGEFRLIDGTRGAVLGDILRGKVPIR